MNIKGWIMGVSWGFLCPISWGLVDELVDSEPEERSESEESFVLGFPGDIRPSIVEIPIDHAARPEDDDMARFVQAIEDYANFDDRVLAVEILMNHVHRDDLGPMLQIIREKLDKNDQEAIIEDVKGLLDSRGLTLELQILEEYLV
jgi:hypothetical protein